MHQYAQSILSSDIVGRVDEHTASCAPCRELLALALEPEGSEVAAANGEIASDEIGQLFVALDADTDDPRGKVVAEKYALVRLLGSGGMGLVYEATNVWTGRRVALKVLRPQHIANREVVNRFIREARTATRIDHPSVVQVVDFGKYGVDGSFYMAQELLEGETLRERLDKEARMALPDAVRILLPVMHALGRAHDAAVVHRDVKPENIVLSVEPGGSAWRPKLIDFGICKTGPTGQGTTGIRTGHPIGTTLYMSPEQVRAEEVDGRTDVWAIGVVLYELLAGRRPFEGNSPGEIASQILTHDPPPLRTLAPDVPDDVERVVAKALAKERAERWPTMQAMVDALLGCGAVADAGGLTGGSVARGRGRSRRMGASSALAIACLALGGLLGARWASGRHDDRAAPPRSLSSPPPALAAPPPPTPPAAAAPEAGIVTSAPAPRVAKHAAGHGHKRALAEGPSATVTEPPSPRPRPPILEP